MSYFSVESLVVGSAACSAVSNVSLSLGKGRSTG